MKAESPDVDVTLSCGEPSLSIDPSVQSNNSFFLSREQISTKTRDFFLCIFNSTTHYTQFCDSITSAWEPASHFIYGFILGITLNFLGIPILRRNSQRRRRTAGFVVGCLFSFLIFFGLLLLMAGFVRHDTIARSDFKEKHGKNSKQKYVPASFHKYLSGLASKAGKGFRGVFCFWCKEKTVVVKKVSKRENKTEQLVKRRIDKFKRLKQQFAANYNF